MLAIIFEFELDAESLRTLQNVLNIGKYIDIYVE